MRNTSVPTGIFAALACLGVVTFSTMATADTVDAEASDTAAIHAFWTTLDTIWKSGDAKRFSALFAADGSFYFVDREHTLENRAAILDYFNRQFPNIAPEISHRTTVHKVRPLAPETRAVDATVEILRDAPDGTAAPAVLRTFAVFGVMQQADDEWQIQVLSAYQLPAADGGS
jgi:uncharacterized protein (TIGR02246 family)